MSRSFIYDRFVPIPTIADAAPLLVQEVKEVGEVLMVCCPVSGPLAQRHSEPRDVQKDEKKA
jgi:hypothetical protein